MKRFLIDKGMLAPLLAALALPVLKLLAPLIPQAAGNAVAFAWLALAAFGIVWPWLFAPANRNSV